ncbi:MAG: hypothetical protein APF76_11085 [Desulfitibacter sp. BRH_c19]|nr:MAG: hypothetical protein APF76_11085 [Desulfitibacter sp. BRH_c19]
MSKLTKLAASVIGVVIIILLITYGSFMGVYYYTSTPEFCSGCHYIKPYVTSWNNSPHQDVNCLQCHEPTGSLGKLHSKSRGLNYYVSDITENYVMPIISASYINNKGCFGCHTGQYPNFPNAVTIKNNQDHLEYLKEDRTCSSCHNDTGHETNIGIDEIFID